jgi:UDP-GlcNAc:undecaprenyl-phosphate/decaprenyl-phosphate GlcNAc-1-phosphate transferase
MITFFTLSISLALGYLLCYYLIQISGKLQAIQQQSHSTHQVRWSAGDKPRVGGWVFYTLFLLGVIVYLVAPFLDGHDAPIKLLPLVLSVSLGFGMGLSDDAMNLRPWVKFGIQILCGVIMIAFGIYIQLFGIAILDYALTIFWVVGIMNSVNMLDNMDGITGSVSAGILLMLLVILKVLNLDLGAFYYVNLAVLGALVGFLLLNLYPSKLYMGDSGSQFLGVFLAFLGIEYLWNLKSVEGELIFSRQLLMPLLVFLMPILDTTFVTVVRIARGDSPFKGGRDHITHHMVYLGIRERFVPLITVGVTLISGMVMLSAQMVVKGWSHFHTLLYGGYVVAIFALFIVLYRRGDRNRRAIERLRRMQSNPKKAEAKAPVPVKEKAMAMSAPTALN